ncbi:uncharacterized protein BXIN_0194 [Babesia sp. Xinjiang]|uniref:uncharacterized protein n=1 Tax=Babesia sp. Xinjiang TaxID=462227 RepID=UPI000A2334D9|nr:uncharacterized protein BXIN_0194 [Babesia sp. Xinjiang]ORM39838.1 hypothetical protein BXIN_0194 [Babesia sp. Xinjiang]
MIWIKYGRAHLAFTVQIPPTENGIFKPKSIIECPYVLRQPYTVAEHVRHLNIDISDCSNANIDVIILGNIRRGCWIYTQFNIVPLRNSPYVLVKVTNSKYQCDIYEATDGAMVTHVELFDHAEHGWQYVVINIGRRTSENIRRMSMSKEMKVYKRIDGDDNIVYFDLSNFWVDPYIEMLYNIDTGEPQSDEQQVSSTQTGE